jgi:regulator of sigma E protease
MTSLLAFLFVLGVLVFVHELGHFLVARWHGVRVLTFSLGFGPKLLKWRRGDTEYAISAIPLGGYVKMAGEMGGDGSADFAVQLEGKPDEFMSKTKWQRFQIFVAGPVMNIILALVVMTFVLYQGASEPAYLSEPPRIGAIVPGSAAEKVGLETGDLIVSVAGRSVANWDQLDMAVVPRANRELELVIERDGNQRTIKVTPDARTKYEMGDLGVVPILQAQLALINPGEQAEKAGLKAGDIVVALNGQRLQYEEFTKLLRASPNQQVMFTVKRGEKHLDIPVQTINKDGLGWIGVSLSAAEGPRIEPTFLQAIQLSGKKNLEWSTMIFQTFAGLFKGETSPKQLMGPVGIAQLSGTAAAISWVALFSLMAMISLNLGILNLLPIPMLDGGHIFIMALEGVARRDFSLRVKEKMLMVGFVALMFLMVTVIYNDLTRVEWIERLMPWR